MFELGVGSEFNCKFWEEVWRKKYGIVFKEFWFEDQFWLFWVNGKLGRKFKGIKKGGVIENMFYYIFIQCFDGVFEVFFVYNWYNFILLVWYCMFIVEEVEEEWERRNKVLNYFSIMQQWWFKDQDQDEDEEEKEKCGCRKVSELCIYDLEDDLEMLFDVSDVSGEEGGRVFKVKKKVLLVKGGRKKKKKKGLDDEVFEDSDDGDFEG